MNKHALFIIAALLLASSATLHAAEPPLVSADPYANETPEQRDARMGWWREARFGLFIHWGLYSVLAGQYEGQPVEGYGEWVMHFAKIPVEKYKTYAKSFNPTKYDADAWVRLAKQAGMKYIIITAKHHDGFTLFPSAVSDWGIGMTPYKKDLLKPLAEACRKQGLKLGFYYSQARDWVNPGSGNYWDPDYKNDSNGMDAYIKNIAVPQVRELLTNYGEFPNVLWWDTPEGMNEDRAADLIEVLKLKPGIIHNNRLLKVASMGAVDMNALGKKRPFGGDTETPEQHVPSTGLGNVDWETCMTMNGTWGYRSDDTNWKSTKGLLQNLVDIASKGGNYLLNVGPTAEGLIPAACVQRLEEIGQWMDVNSESIYGTTASPFAKLPWGRCTVRKHEGGTTLYLHVFDWPANGTLDVRGLMSPVISARLLAGGEELEFNENEQGVLLRLPVNAPDTNASVIKMEIQGDLEVVAVLIKPAADRTISFPAKLADMQQPRQGGACQLDTLNDSVNIGHWLNSEAWVSWEFTGAEAGIYEVVADVAGLDDSKATLEIGEEKLPIAFTKTGNYNEYKPQVLGQIKIAGEGVMQLSIRPAKEDWQAVNIRQVTLRPVKF